MTKTDLIKAVAETAAFSKKDSEKAVNAVIDSITAGLKNGEKIQISGFGTFEVKSKPAREGINPKTGEKIQIPESKIPTFKFGKAYKDEINN